MRIFYTLRRIHLKKKRFKIELKNYWIKQFPKVYKKVLKTHNFAGQDDDPITPEMLMEIEGNRNKHTNQIIRIFLREVLYENYREKQYDRLELEESLPDDV